MQILVEGREVPLPSAKQRALLALLLLQAGEVVSTERLVDALWGERPPATATHALRVHLSELRKAFRAAGAPDLLVTRRPGYALEIEPEQLDLRRFELLLGEAREALAAGAAAAAAARLAEALSLWRGPPLAEFASEPFAQAEARRLEELRLTALEERIEAELALGRHAELVGEIEALVTAEPLRERLRGQLMVALYRSGRQAEALEAYQDARRVLVDELGIEPGPALQAVERAILRQEESLAPAPAAARTLRSLPSPPTPLVGRTRELAAASALLARDDVRLLTLTGPGGTGKSRLALELASTVAAGDADVCFVPLAAVGDAEFVPAALARALDVKAGPDETLVERLQTHLRGRELLLVLDNFEHVVPAAPLVAELLAAAPRVKAVATSRAPLHLSGEHEFPVPPLAVPDPADAADLAAVARSEAVALLVERSQAVDPSFRLTEANAAAVAEICIRLDGLPLAIELAAARTKLLSPSALLSRLEHRLQLLTGGARDLPVRQQTLRSTIDWSYGLLEQREQRLFARLGVFGGGWTLDAAEAICDGELGLDPLEGVASLLDKSLLRRDERSEDGQRFELLETIREFALDRLAAGGEEEDARRRHAHYYLGLAEASEEGLAGPAQREWLGRLEAEQDNFRAALAWSLAGGSPEQGLRIAAALGAFWGAHDHESEGRRWLEQELAACPGAPPELRARALHAVGALALEQGDAAPGEALLAEALTLFRTLDDARGIARTLALMAAPAAYEGAYERAAALCAESMELAREAGDRRTVAAALNNLAATANLQARYGEARRLLEQSLELRRELGDARGVAYSLNNLGYNSLLEEDHERARSELEEALLLAEQLGNKDLTALALGNLGLVALYLGDLGRAALRFERALTLCRELDNRRLVPECLLGLAGVAALAAQPARAARLAGAAESLREQLGAPLLPSERIVAERFLPLAEATLGGVRFAAERTAGRRLGLEEAVAGALETSAESAADAAEVA